MGSPGTDTAVPVRASRSTARATRATASGTCRKLGKSLTSTTTGPSGPSSTSTPNRSSPYTSPTCATIRATLPGSGTCRSRTPCPGCSGEERSVANSSPSTQYTLRSVPEFGTYGCAISSPSPASSGPTSSRCSGPRTSRTPRPELPSAGLTTSGYSAAGISASRSQRAAAYVTGTGRPRVRPITAASALSRTPRIERTSFTVVSPTAAAASSRVSPGPPETVLRTQASWLPPRTASEIANSESPGRSTSTR